MSDFVDTLSIDVPAKPKRSIAGFWRRFIAFVIDEFIVSIPCWVIGLMFFDVFATREWFGFMIGAFVTWPYFALMGSSVGGGQTIGMRLLDMRVVNRECQPISPTRSLIRCVILILPFTFNASVLPGSLPVFVTTLVDTALMAVGLSIFYLYLFNVRTRQSLHDLGWAHLS